MLYLLNVTSVCLAPVFQYRRNQFRRCITHTPIFKPLHNIKEVLQYIDGKCKENKVKWIIESLLYLILTKRVEGLRVTCEQ